MAISFFYDKQLVVARMRTTSGYKKSYQTTATVQGAIQHDDKQANTETGLVSDKRWEGYAPLESGIQEGDRITVSVGPYTKVFKVMAVQPIDYGSAVNQHLELVLVEYPNA